jgi:predicted small secreted protein
MRTDRTWRVRGAAALTLLALGGLPLLSGCNTIRGAGEDISAAGSAVSSGAESTEEKIEESTQ